MAVDVLLVSLGTTAGLRLVDEELTGSLERAGASVAVALAAPRSEPRTFALTDLVQARAARRAAAAALEEHSPRAVLYSTTTAALLWPRPGRSTSMLPRPGTGRAATGSGSDLWSGGASRPRPWSCAQSEGGLEEAPAHDEALVIPVPVEPSGPPEDSRDVAAVTYAADVEKKGLRGCWRRGAGRGATARSWSSRESRRPMPTASGDGVRFAGLMEPDEFRALLGGPAST